jgi:hypothetical protein
MPTGRNLFTAKTITGTIAAAAVPVPVGDVDFIALGITVTNMTGGASFIFAVQWSFDGDVWTDALADPEDTIATFTGNGSRVKRIPVKATYWRLGAVVQGGTNPSCAVTANALVW